MKRELAVSTVVLTLGAFAAPAVAAPPRVPQGTSYWVNKTGDVIVMKRSGTKLRVGNPLTPCFTGVKGAGSKYTGGGYDQGGGYTSDTVVLKLQAFPSAVNVVFRSTGKPGSWYFKTTKKKAAKAAKKFGMTDGFESLFSDCLLQ